MQHSSTCNGVRSAYVTDWRSLACRYMWVTHEDVQNLHSLKGQTVLGLRAPLGSNIEVIQVRITRSHPTSHP